MVNLINHHHNNCSKCINYWWEWAKENITKPINGFGAKKNLDGTFYDFTQQTEATHLQIYWIIRDLCSRGKNSSCIQSILTGFI